MHHDTGLSSNRRLVESARTEAVRTPGRWVLAERWCCFGNRVCRLECDQSRMEKEILVNFVDVILSVGPKTIHCPVVTLMVLQQCAIRDAVVHVYTHNSQALKLTLGVSPFPLYNKLKMLCSKIQHRRISVGDQSR